MNTFGCVWNGSIGRRQRAGRIIGKLACFGSILAGISASVYGFEDGAVLRASDRPIERHMIVGNYDTVVPQMADGAGWQTTFLLTNLTQQTVHIACGFYADSGDSQSVPIAGYGNLRVIGGPLRPNQSIEFSTTGTGAQLLQGSAVILSLDKPLSDPTAVTVTNKVGGYAIFRQRVEGRPDFEAVVPISPMFEKSFTLFYDNRAGYSTGLAVINGSTTATTVQVSALDIDGNLILSDSIPLTALQKVVYSVPIRYPSLQGRVGILQFSGSGAALSGLGLRFNPGGAFTSTHTLSGPK